MSTLICLDALTDADWLVLGEIDRRGPISAELLAMDMQLEDAVVAQSVHLLWRLDLLAYSKDWDDWAVTMAGEEVMCAHREEAHGPETPRR